MDMINNKWHKFENKRKHMYKRVFAFPFFKINCFLCILDLSEKMYYVLYKNIYFD